MTIWVCLIDDDDGWYGLHKIPSCKKTCRRSGGTSAKTGFPCVRVVIICDKESSVCCAAFNTVRSPIVSVKLAELGRASSYLCWDRIKKSDKFIIAFKPQTPYFRDMHRLICPIYVTTLCLSLNLSFVNLVGLQNLELHSNKV